MGIKGDKRQPTNEQVRFARLTLEGNSADDDASNIQKLIKKIIETTSCSHAEAEIALLDNDNDIQAAIEHILESDKLDSWTEQKGARKEKKKQEEERSFNNNNYHRDNTTNTRTFVQRGRGAGGFSDRGGRGRSSNGPRENFRDRDQNRDGSRPTRGGFDRPNTFAGRGGRGGGRGGYSRAVAPESSAPPNFDEKPEATKVETTVTETQKPVEESVTTTVAAASPFSFAAVAAAAHRKEELRRQKGPQAATAAPQRSQSPAPPAPVEEEVAAVAEEVVPPHEEPETSHHEEKVENVSYQSEQSALPEEPLASVSNHADDSHNSQSKAWTKQLKSELGIGLGESVGLAPTSPIPSNVSIQSLPDPGVEFVGIEPSVINDYSFGYVETPVTPILPPAEISVASISTNNSDNIFNSGRISVSAKPVEQERAPLPNGDFNLKSASPPNAYNQSNRALSYDTSSVSYAPTDRGLSANKPFNQPGQLSAQQQSQVQQQQQQQQQVPQQQQAQPQSSLQQQQQQAPQPPQQSQHPHQPFMMPPQLQYPYSYMNMYDPVSRDGQYAAAALMQYGMGGVDLSTLSTILPQNALSQAAPSQPLQTGQQRGDSHSLMDFNKFATQGTRDQQQPSNVGPPPGFQTTNYMQQPNLSSLFMQQPYPTAPHAFGFMNMMPSVGTNGGRQMYGQEDERKSYEKMTSKPTAQQNPHSQFQQHQAGNLGGMYSNKSKTYNWSN